jgi:hypothetical protein
MRAKVRRLALGVKHNIINFITRIALAASVYLFADQRFCSQEFQQIARLPAGQEI